MEPGSEERRREAGESGTDGGGRQELKAPLQPCFYLWGRWGTHQCRGPLGGRNWPGRSPQGRGTWGPQGRRRGCGQGTVSRGHSQTMPCRNPQGKLRNRVEAWLTSPTLPGAPHNSQRMSSSFLPGMESSPLSSLFPSLGQRLVCHFTGGGIAFPLMEKVRWARATGRSSTRCGCL